MTLAADVERVRAAVRAADPDAYEGFVTDAAVRAVARVRNARTIEVLRAYRAEHPAVMAGTPWRGFPIGAQSVTGAGITAARDAALELEGVTS